MSPGPKFLYFCFYFYQLLPFMFKPFISLYHYVIYLCIPSKTLWKFTLSDISKFTIAFFWLLMAWRIFPHILPLWVNLSHLTLWQSLNFDRCVLTVAFNVIIDLFKTTVLKIIFFCLVCSLFPLILPSPLAYYLHCCDRFTVGIIMLPQSSSNSFPLHR